MHRHIQSLVLDQLNTIKHFCRGPGQNHMAIIHDDHPVCQQGLFHMVRDVDHGQTLFPDQISYQSHEIGPGCRIEHGGCFVQDQAGRLHRQDAGDGQLLFLAS